MNSQHTGSSDIAMRLTALHNGQEWQPHDSPYEHVASHGCCWCYIGWPKTEDGEVVLLYHTLAKYMLCQQMTKTLFGWRRPLKAILYRLYHSPLDVLSHSSFHHSKKNSERSINPSYKRMTLKTDHYCILMIEGNSNKKIKYEIMTFSEWRSLIRTKNMCCARCAKWLYEHLFVGKKNNAFGGGDTNALIHKD